MSSQRDEVRRQIEELNSEQGKLTAEISLFRDGQALDPGGHRTTSIRSRLPEIKRDLERLAIQDRQLHDEELANAHAREAAIDQARREDRSFWFRRFHTSLALAHGAGFAAISSKLFDPALKAATASYAFYPMGAFAIGMVLAGLIPVALYRDAGRSAWALAGASALLFCGALVASLIAVWRQTGWPFP